MALPLDYEERVYAGVLGKIIGVYLGRPFEGWTYERICSELGQITGYVHDRLGLPLIVTDDDITGTFTFFRALEDSGYDPELSAAAIGQAWLNYLIEGRTILWWGGLGNSTEHTAYLRLKAGIPAPQSGSIATNGQVVAEQIGAQIFIDAWAMACPGEPDRAAELARRAASVSHDGVAVDAAVLLAAMEAQAFVERDIDRLLEVGLAQISADSVIARMIADLREWRAVEPDWQIARVRFAERYGYHRYAGNVHVVPNHGLIQMALLWGADDFDQTMTIVNTSGWDTDCNSGNVGCLQGIRLGLAGLDAGRDWRGPVADRLYLPTAEGGRSITDAVTEAGRIAAVGRRLASEVPVSPKAGARFHFEHPGAVQGFGAVAAADGSSLPVANVVGGSVLGTRSLRVPLPGGSGSVRLVTPTFIPPDALVMPGYPLLASPSLHPGQVIRASVMVHSDADGDASVRLVAGAYNGEDELRWLGGEPVRLRTGDPVELVWQVPDTDGQPVAQVGVEATSPAGGALHLDWLAWAGVPRIRLGRPAAGGTLWRRAWVDGMDHWEAFWPEAFRLTQDRGTGLIMQGSTEWCDYVVEADVTVHMATAAGVAAYVGGMRRYYALVLVADGNARLLRMGDDGQTVLAEAWVGWQPFRASRLSLEVVNRRLTATVDGVTVASLDDPSGRPHRGGAVALLCAEGTMACDEVRIWPAD